MLLRFTLVLPALVLLLAERHAPQPAETPAVPGPRIGHSLVYDERLRQVVLLDGYSWIRAVSPIEPPPLTEVWGWNGAMWSRLAGAGPASRNMGRAVFDASRGAVLSYGGRVGRSEQPSSELWQWDASGWSKLSDAAAGPTVHIEMAYDEARRQVVRYGGATREGPGRFVWRRETWVWRGGRWDQVSRDGPTGRAAAAMVYDAARREIVLFGGQGEAPAPGQPQPQFNDTWTWNGTAWRRVATDGPPGRAFHAMVFDRAREQVILYGGNRGDGTFDDIWAWNGSDWTRLQPAGVTPGKRRLHAMAYDTGRRKTVLYGGAGPQAGGGTSVYADTWEWDGQRWTSLR